MKIAILILGGAYVLVCVLAFIFQSRLVFFPDRHDAGSPADAGIDYRDVVFHAQGGRRLHGWYIAAPDSGYTLLFCHGNAGNITHRVGSIRQFMDVGLGVFIFDYGGYGESWGRPSERGTYEDAEAAWDWLVGEAGVSPERIVLFGRSLGGAVAIDLATRVKPRALIVESSFTSIPELGARQYPWLPVRYLSRIHYNNAKKVPHLRVPKLFIHSLNDDVVSYGMGKRLYRYAARPKEFLRIRGTHNEGSLVSEPKYEAGIREFIASLDAPRRSAARDESD